MLKNLRLTSQNKILLMSFVVLLSLYFVLSARNDKLAEAGLQAKDSGPIYADTLIPKGQVLIPIELANVDSVAGLIDQFGIVDLYSGDENKSVLVASRLKILRAPLNKNQYAVMVPEASSGEIMKMKGPYTAVVQNRYAKPESTAVAAARVSVPPAEKPKPPVRHVEIEYFQGENR